MRWAAAIFGLCAFALPSGLLVGCGRGVSGGVGTLVSTGEVRVGGAVVHPGGTRRLVRNDLVTVTSGGAVVTLHGGGRLEMRPGTSVLFAEPTQLQAGDLLVESARQPVHVDTAIGAVDVDGAARLQRDLALEVGTYRGTTTVAAGRPLTVPALAEDTVPAVGVAPLPTPIQLDAADAWDQRFLGAAIELTSQLDGQSAFVSANTAPAQARTIAFYRRAVDRLASTPGLDDSLLAGLPGGTPPAGDGVVAASIALAGPGAFAQRWRAVFALRVTGGQWGVVALIERADPELVLELVSQAVDGSALAPPAVTLASTSLPPAPAQQSQPEPGQPPTTTTTTAPTRPAGLPASPHPPTTTTTTAPGLTIPSVTLPGPGGQGTTTTTTPPSDLGPVLDPVVNIVHSLTSTTL